MINHEGVVVVEKVYRRYAICYVGNQCPNYWCSIVLVTFWPSTCTTSMHSALPRMSDKKNVLLLQKTRPVATSKTKHFFIDLKGGGKDFFFSFKLVIKF